MKLQIFAPGYKRYNPVLNGPKSKFVEVYLQSNWRPRKAQRGGYEATIVPGHRFQFDGWTPAPSSSSINSWFPGLLSSGFESTEPSGVKAVQDGPGGTGVNSGKLFF